MSSDEGTAAIEQSDEWKIAVITLQSPGPRYAIRLDSGAVEAVDDVEFNGFKLGLDGRAEVEYKTLEIEEEDFTYTAKFFDGSVDVASEEVSG